MIDLEGAPSGDMLEPWRAIPALADALNAGAKRPSFTEAALRNYLAKRHSNGLDQFVRKIGKKTIVSEPGFNYWLGQQTGQMTDQLELNFGENA